MKQANLQWEWAEVTRGLDNLQQVEANFQGRAFLFRSQLQAAGFTSDPCRRSGASADFTRAAMIESKSGKCSAKALWPCLSRSTPTT
jgi:hypothetical protein